MDLKKLHGKIGESGIKKKEIAKRLGITPQALNHKLDGNTKFSVDEAQKLCQILQIDCWREAYEMFLWDGLRSELKS